MKMKIAAAFTVALVAVIGLAVAQDFNNFGDDFNNFNDFGDDNSAFFGRSQFGGVGVGGISSGLGIPQSSISVGQPISVGGGYPTAAFNPIPLPAQRQGGGLGSFLPLLIFFLFFLFNRQANNDQIILLNGTTFA